MYKAKIGQCSTFPLVLLLHFYPQTRVLWCFEDSIRNIKINIWWKWISFESFFKWRGEFAIIQISRVQWTSPDVFAWEHFAIPHVWRSYFCSSRSSSSSSSSISKLLPPQRMAWWSQRLACSAMPATGLGLPGWYEAWLGLHKQFRNTVKKLKSLCPIEI